MNSVNKMGKIMWPTLYLFLLNTFLIISMLFNFTSTSYFMYLPIMSVLMYFNFTPFHESAHNLIASKNYKFLNNIIGHTSNFIYTSSFPAWKFIHKQHHLYTNNSDLDPDKFYNNLTEIFTYGWFLDYIYFYYYLNHFNSRPFKEKLTFISTIMFYLFIFKSIVKNNLFINFLLAFYIPQRCALMMASFILDYNTHHDCEDYTITKNNSLITNKISGIKEHDDYPLLTSIITQNQNYHNVHHINTSVPFYDYKNVWDEIKNKQMKRGTKLKTILELKK